MNEALNPKGKSILRACILTGIVGIFLVIAALKVMNPKTVTIYTFKNSYEAGTVVTGDMLTAVQIRGDIKVAGSGAQASSVMITGETYDETIKQGNALRTDVSEGTPLMSSLLTLSGGSQIESALDASKVAITVSVTSITGVSDDLNADSRVNIYTMQSDATVLLLQNMRVIHVAKDDGNAIVSATVECTNDEALKLVNAESTSTLYFGLVNSSGYETTKEAEPSYKSETEGAD